MAVPASGEISMIKIRNELGNNNYNGSVIYSNISLTSMSTGGHGTINSVNAAADRPNGSAPHSMSEFYSYDHDAALVSYTGRAMRASEESALTACGKGALSVTIYHNSIEEWDADGTTWYTSNTGETEVDDGYYKDALGLYGYYYEGGDKIYFSCGRSERRLKYNIEFIGDSPMGIPMYHFNYKNEEHGKGRFVGTMVEDLQRLGFEDNVFEQNGELWVIYDKRIDVPFESVTN